MKMLINRIICCTLLLTIWCVLFIVSAESNQPCGNTLSWVLDSDGTLTISGNGEMYDWETGKSPWYSKKDSITNVIIQSGVTSIGSSAFGDLSNLNNIHIPASITKINPGAFYNCCNLSVIHFSSDKTDWESINIYGQNDALFSSTVLYNRAYTYYVSQGSSGIGTLNNPYGSIEEGIVALDGKSGVIIILGSYDITAFKVNEGWEGMVTVKGADEDAVITVKKGAGIIFRGDITFKDIKFEIGEFAHFNPNGTKLIMDGGEDSEFGYMMHLSTYANAVVEEAYAEFKSGTIATVHAAGGYSTSSVDGCTGDSTIIVDGATVKGLNISANAYMENQTGISIGGNLNIIYNSGAINTIGFKSQTKPEIKGALNFIFNNGMETPEKFVYPKESAAQGVFIIKSGIGGTVYPVNGIPGSFSLCPNPGNVAFINGKYVSGEIIELAPGETIVEWKSADNVFNFCTDVLQFVDGKNEYYKAGISKSTSSAPFISNNEFMLSADTIAECTALNVIVENDLSSVTFKHKNITVKFPLNSNTYYVNGVLHSTSAMTCIYNGHIYIQASRVLEKCGYISVINEQDKTFTCGKLSQITSFNGAQIRTTGVQGLRFVFSIPKLIYNVIYHPQSNTDKEDGLGCVVMPKKYLGDNILTKETYAVIDGKTYFAKTCPAVNILKETDTEILFTVCITGIERSNYNSEYVAVPYVTVSNNTIYGEPTSRVSVYSIAELMYNDSSTDSSVINYLDNVVFDQLKREKIFIKGTAHHKYNISASEYSNLLNVDYVVVDRKDSSGKLLIGNEIIPMESLGLKGSSDNYFLQEITVLVEKRETADQDIVCGTITPHNKKITVAADNIIINRSSETSIEYFVGGQTSTQSTKVMTGVINFGDMPGYIDNSLIPSVLQLKNSVKFIDMSGGIYDSLNPQFEYRDLISFDNSYKLNTDTGAYDFLDIAFEKAFPTLYHNGLYEADVYDSNGDGYADYVFIKNYLFTQLQDNSMHSFSEGFDKSMGYNRLYTKHATVTGNYSHNSFVLAYINFDAHYIDIVHTITSFQSSVNSCITAPRMQQYSFSDGHTLEFYNADKKYIGFSPIGELELGSTYICFAKKSIPLYVAKLPSDSDVADYRIVLSVSTNETADANATSFELLNPKDATVETFTLSHDFVPEITANSLVVLKQKEESSDSTESIIEKADIYLFYSSNSPVMYLFGKDTDSYDESMLFLDFDEDGYWYAFDHDTTILFYESAEHYMIADNTILTAKNNPWSDKLNDEFCIYMISSDEKADPTSDIKIIKTIIVSPLNTFSVSN